jgi:hypothetical protein
VYAAIAARNLARLGAAEVAAAYDYVGASAPTPAGEDGAAAATALLDIASRFDAGARAAWLASAGTARHDDHEHAAHDSHARALSSASPAASSLLHDAHAVSALATETAVASAQLLLAALARGTAGLLLAEYLRIPRLSRGGGRQLAADIEFLASLLSSLAVTPEPMLERVAQLAVEPTALLSTQVQADVASGASAGRSGGPGDADVPLRRLFARVRGVV